MTKIYKMDGYNLHIIKSKKFKKIEIQINFSKSLKKEEVTKRIFLASLLGYSTKKYGDSKKFDEKCEDLYGISLYAKNARRLDTSIIRIGIKILQDKYTESGNLNKAVDFLYEIIMNPNVNENKFDIESFEEIKKYAISRLKEDERYPDDYASIRVSELNGFIDAIRTNGYIEDLEKITPENLYSYYKKVMKNDLVNIIIFGNVNPRKIKKMFKNKFSFKTTAKYKRKEYPLPKYKKENPKTIKEKFTRPLKQANVNVLLRTTEKDYKKRLVTNLIYSVILGGLNSSLIYNKLRIENNLAYSAGTSNRASSNTLLINTLVDKDNSKRVLKYIDEELVKIKKGDFPEELMELSKELIIKSQKSEKYDPYQIIENYFLDYLYNTNFSNPNFKEIERVSKKDVIEVAKKFKIVYKYILLSGDANEED